MAELLWEYMTASVICDPVSLRRESNSGTEFDTKNAPSYGEGMTSVATTMLAHFTGPLQDVVLEVSEGLSNAGRTNNRLDRRVGRKYGQSMMMNDVNE